MSSKSILRGRNRASALAALMAVVVGAAGLLVLTRGSADAGSAGPLEAAWTRARAEGSYHFLSEVVQVTTPSATVANAGKTDRKQTLHLEGDSDVAASAMELKISTDATSSLAGAAGLGIRVVDGVTYQRSGGGEWVASSAVTDGLAPSGDFMSYLRTARDIAEAGTEQLAGQTVTKYVFSVDGDAFAAATASQLAQAARSNPKAHVVPASTYTGVTGTGALWVGSDGLPLRQSLSLVFPHRGTDSLSTNTTVDFSQYGTATVPGVPHPSTSGWHFGSLGDYDGELLLLAAIALLIAAAVIGSSNSSRKPLSLANVVAMFVVFGLVGANVVPERAQAAPAVVRTGAAPVVLPATDLATAALEYRRSGSAAKADPHLNRLASVPSVLAVAPQVTSLIDTGANSDTDTLTDFVEERIGTDPLDADTDHDGVNDDVEISGFTVACPTNAAAAAVRWYGDPEVIDSNDDGVPDGQEWVLDTDGDCSPDLFDDDNDGDGVPDRVDLGQNTVVGASAPFSDTSPLELKLGGLTSTEALPTMVEFQIRPSDANRIEDSLRPMNWPADAEGQIRDLNDDPTVDDISLLPMLEIIVPQNHVLPSTEDLSAVGVSIEPVDASGTKGWYVYAPLTVVKDPSSGLSVALAGRMLYNSNSSWATSQQVRLVWMVQVKNDLPCDAAAVPAIAGCNTATGYIYDRPQIVQVYNDDWKLTGLNVTEEHGTDMAVVYEDPTMANADIADSSPTLLVQALLNDRFLAAAPDASVPPQFVFDITMGNIKSQLSHGPASAAESYGVPDVFSVDTGSHAASFDQALMDLGQKLMPAALAKFPLPPAVGDYQPQIVSVYSSKSRGLGLEASTNTIIDHAITVDLAAAEVPIVTAAGTKLNPWCAQDNGAVKTWQACDPTQVVAEVERASADFVAFDPDNPDLPYTGTDPDIRAGELQLAVLYTLAMVQGETVMQQLETPQGEFKKLQTTQEHLDMKTKFKLGGTVFKVGIPVAGFKVTLDAFKAAVRVPPTQLLKGLVLPLTEQGAIVIDELTPTTRILNRLLGLSKIGKGVAGVAVVGMLVAGYFAVKFLAAEGNEVALKRTVDVALVAVGTYMLVETVVMVRSLATQFKAVGQGLGSALGASSSRAFGAMAKFAIVGAVIAGLARVAFFIYEMVDGGVTAFSPEFNVGLADVIADLLYIALLTALSLTVVGGVVVAVVVLIDAIITLVCDELGVTDCTTISSATTSVIKLFIFGSEPMVDVDASDLISISKLDYSLVDSKKQYSQGNGLNQSVDVTSTIRHESPSAWQMTPLYVGMYSKANIQSGNFVHSLNGAPAIPGAGTWGSVTVNGSWSGKNLYQATKTDTAVADGAHVAQFTKAGLNKQFSSTLYSAYTLPSYECWTIPNPVLFPIPVIPVCYDRTITGNTSSAFPNLVLDIFPATIGEFVATSTRTGFLSEYGPGLPWDFSFATMSDFDGDGLDSSRFGGLDPDDTKVDTDSDGLGDKVEIDLQAAGYPVSPLAADTDGDGLNDRIERQIGTNPSVNDTDNDGLDDGVEVLHVETNQTGVLAPAGGWDITVGSVTFRAHSDPNKQDSDSDGISDLAEKQLSQDPLHSVDDQNRPYHPMVINTAPIGVAMTTPNPGGWFAPGDTVSIATDVTATVPLAPSMLDLSWPAAAGASPSPALLSFDSAGAVPQTRRVSTQLALPSTPRSGSVRVDANVRAWLPDRPSNLPWVRVNPSTNPLGLADKLRVSPRGADETGRYIIDSSASSHPMIRSDGSFGQTSVGGEAPGVTVPACNAAGTCIHVSQSLDIYSTDRDGHVVSSYQDPTQTHVYVDSASDGSGFAVIFYVSNVGGSRSSFGLSRVSARGEVLPGETVIGDFAAGSFESIKLVWMRDRYVLLANNAGSAELIDFSTGVAQRQKVMTGGVGYDMAYNPVTDSILLVSGTSATVIADGSRCVSAGSCAPTAAQDLFVDQRLSSVVQPTLVAVQRNAITSQWNVLYNTGPTFNNNTLLVVAYTDDLILSGNPAEVATGSDLGRSDLACPAWSALPTADLRFEELPGSTTFVDSSNWGRSGVAVPGSAPAAGYSAHPQAAKSRFAASFALGDQVVIPLGAAVPTTDAVSLAFWYRSPNGGSVTPFTVDTGTSGYQLSVGPSGSVRWSWGSDELVVPTSLNDGGWHFLTATRDPNPTANKASALVGDPGLAVYVDGVAVGSPALSASPTIAPTSQITISGGGSQSLIDNFQVYGVALGSYAVRALHERFEQTCLVASNTLSSLDFPSPTERGGSLFTSSSLTLRIDGDAAVSSVTLPSVALNRSVSTYVLSGTASDGVDGSGVSAVEVSLNGGPWLTANGADVWTMAIPIAQADVQIRTRATDRAGHVEVPSAASVLKVDKVNPVVTLNGLGRAVVPTRDAVTNELRVALTGTATDAGSGIGDRGVEVNLSPAGSPVVADAWQAVKTVAGVWSLDYVLAGSGFEASGSYTVRVRATDVAGNGTADNAATAALIVDNTAPVVTLSATDAARGVVAGSVRLRGAVTDLGGAGVAHVDVAFTRVSTVAGVDAAPTVWSPAVVAQANGLATSTTWSFAVPSGLEDVAQIDLRATDSLGNESIVRRVWSGIVDTSPPRLTLSATPTGKLWPTSKRVEMTYDCRAEDLFLDVRSFVCPGSNTTPATRGFLTASVLYDAMQILFPDQPILNSLSLTNTKFEKTSTKRVTLDACDMFGNCGAQTTSVTSTASLIAASTAVALRSAAQSRETTVSANAVADPTPVVVVVEPSSGQHVAVAGSVEVLAAASAPTSLRRVEILLDGQVVVTRGFGFAVNYDYAERVDVALSTGGQHTVLVRATGWDDLVSTMTPVTFFSDLAAPVVTFDASDVTLARTWAVGTDFYRFSGTVADDGTVAAVQIQINGGRWQDVTFGGGTWRTAARVADADGTTLVVRVRAFDLAGRVGEVGGTTHVDLVPAQAIAYVRPDTAIVSGPAAVLASSQASFTFSGTPGDRGIAAFRCWLDSNAPVTCDVSFVLDGLAAGSHTLRVAAIDDLDYVDLSGAVTTWTVTATGPQPAVLIGPFGATTEHSGTFTFEGPAGATFECTLDGSIAEACTSPRVVSSLADGAHTFTLRATVGGVSGTALSRSWTVTDYAPVAADQQVVVEAGNPAGKPITLVATDADALVYRIVDQPVHGFLEGTAPDVTYVPFTDFLGTDSFTFVADDGQHVSLLATASVDVRVPDRENPVIVNPGNQTIRTPYPGNGPLTYRMPTATDNSGSGTVTCSPASGTRFVVGSTTVSCTATDAAGNTASTSFVIRHIVGSSGAGTKLPVTGNGYLPINEALMLIMAGIAMVIAARRRSRLL